MKIADYEIIKGAYLPALELKVLDYIKDGWVPQGGAFTYNGYWYQTMIKLEECITV